MICDASLKAGLAHVQLDILGQGRRGEGDKASATLEQPRPYINERPVFDRMARISSLGMSIVSDFSTIWHCCFKF